MLLLLLGAGFLLVSCCFLRVTFSSLMKAVCFTFDDYTCTFIVLWSWKIGTMMYFKFSISPCVTNHSAKLTTTHTLRHTVVGEVMRCLVLSQSNAVHCSLNPVYGPSLAWPASAGSDSPLVPQWGHNLVLLLGLSWFDWWTTSLTIILAICHAISSWASSELPWTHFFMA